MTNKQTGYIILIAAFGMLLVSSSKDIMELVTWSDASTPSFIGTMIGHLGAVITAYVGGRITPTKDDNSN